MNQYFDIHNHCLPRVDDGSKSLEETVQMLKIAYEEGIEQVIVTPHYRKGHYEADPKTIAETIRQVEEELKKNQIPVKIYQGNEIFYKSGSVEALENAKSSTLASSNYVLVEYYPNTRFDEIKKGLQELATAGYYPILAHVERYEAAGKLERIEELLDMGVYIQVNAASITGDYGWSIKLFTRKLLKKGYVHFIGTDAHGQKRRAPRMKECANYISRKFGDEYVKELLISNPMKIIQNQYI